MEDIYDRVKTNLGKLVIEYALKETSLIFFRIKEFPNARFCLLNGKISSREYATSLCHTKYNIPLGAFSSVLLYNSANSFEKVFENIPGIKEEFGNIGMYQNSMNCYPDLSFNVYDFMNKYSEFDLLGEFQLIKEREI